MRIETESRERYTILASFHELTTKALVAYHYLNDIIDQKKHEEEATRIRENIEIKLEGLGKKIEINLQEVEKESNQDY